MKKRELFGLLNGLEAVKNLKGVKFAYAVAKNKNLVKREVKLFSESNKPNEKFLEFDKKRVELCQEYCEKNENGEPVIKNNTFIGLEKNDAFNKVIEELREEYKEAIDEREKQSKEYNKMLDEEIELDFHKVLLENVPSDITGQQLELILPIVDDGKKD